MPSDDDDSGSDEELAVDVDVPGEEKKEPSAPVKRRMHSGKSTRSYWHWYFATKKQIFLFADDARHIRLKFAAGKCGHNKNCPGFGRDKVYFMCRGCAGKGGFL